MRAFLDIDPGFGQMWTELGLARPFAGHDRHVTVGGRIGEPDCAIPTCGLDWIRDPAAGRALASGRATPGRGERFTSVASWRGPFGPIEYEGRTYGLRVHEFRRFAELPRRSRGRFELALDIDDADEADRRRLEREGWALVDPRAAAGDPWRYRDYVQRLLGRADDREEPLRRHAQRLVQRPQRLLPRERSPGARPGHGDRGSAPVRAGSGRVQRPSTRPRQGPRRSSTTTSVTAARLESSPRSTWPRAACSPSCSRSSESDDAPSSSPGRSRTRPAAPARRGCG